MADCGCHDNRVDKTWWNEAFLGPPKGFRYHDDDDPDEEEDDDDDDDDDDGKEEGGRDAYEFCSNVVHAARLGVSNDPPRDEGSPRGSESDPNGSGSCSGNGIGPHRKKKEEEKKMNKLMLVVGERDENVDPSATMQLVGALQRECLDHELIVAVGYGHGAADHCPFVRRKRLQFLLRHLTLTPPS